MDYDQCITVHQRTARYPFVHYSTFLCTFSVFHCGNLYFFMLHFLHTAPFLCCSFLCSNLCCTFFRVALFLCIEVFHVALLHVAIFSSCILLLLHSSHFANFSCYNFFTLHYFQRRIQDPHKHIRWRTLQQVNKAVKYCCKALHLKCSRGSWLRLC